ncbi:MAG: hypothetical protein ACI9DC_005043 [Gammaproteobacteria bacterium]
MRRQSYDLSNRVCHAAGSLKVGDCAPTFGTQSLPRNRSGADIQID